MNDDGFVSGLDVRFLSGAPTVLSFGASRSGKSTLASLAASMEYVDHLDEPIEIIIQCALDFLGFQQSIVSEELIKSYISEIKCEMLLLRRANFRPFDASSIWKTKGVPEIWQRLFQLKTRLDALNYMHEKEQRLWITCTDLLPTVKLFKDASINSHKVVVMRDPLEVSEAISSKGWFSDSRLETPAFNTPVTPYKNSAAGTQWFLPWWLGSENFDSFVTADEIGRGLIYWDSIYSSLEITKGSMIDYEVFFFKEIFGDTASVINRLENLLGKAPTKKTKKIAKRLSYIPPSFPDVSKESRDIYQTIIGKYGLKF